MKIRVAGIVNDSIVDGEGLSLTIFVQGCPHRCQGCHNPESHSYDGGKEYDTDAIIAMMDSNPLLDGITLSGGEPFMQPDVCTLLAQAAHSRGLSVWCYTGFTYEQLSEMRFAKHLLGEVDVLIDGRFVEGQKSLGLYFKGSKNQRVIDMARTRGNSKIVLYHE